jgi:hypothetical protein
MNIEGDLVVIDSVIEHSKTHDNEIPKLFNRLKPPPAPPCTRKEYAGGYPAALLRPCLEQGERQARSSPVKGRLGGV